MHMKEMIEKGLVITFDELRVLLGGMGIRSIEGVYMPEKAFTEKEVADALFHLSERELIRAEEDAFVIEPKLKEMLRIIAEPAGTYILDVPGAAEYFCYSVPGAVAVSELYRRKRDALKLRLFTAEEFDAWKEQMKSDYSES